MSGVETDTPGGRLSVPMSRPTSTTDDIRGTWGIVYANRYRATQTEGLRDFDRWLADRDREVREQMLAEFQENEIRALAQVEATVGITLADTEDAQNAARIATALGIGQEADQ